MEQVFEAGRLQKGDFCVVSFPGNTRPEWLCRVVAALPYDEETDRHSMYECITPHGSSLVTGALWVRPANEAEKARLRELEVLVSKTAPPYRGLLRVKSKVGDEGER